MFFKTNKSSINQSINKFINTFSRVNRNKNGCKTKKWFITTYYELSHKFNFYHFFLNDVVNARGVKRDFGLNWWMWKGGRAERCGTEAKKVKCNDANLFCGVIRGWDALRVRLPSLPRPNHHQLADYPTSANCDRKHAGGVGFPAGFIGRVTLRNKVETYCRE